MTFQRWTIFQKSLFCSYLEPELFALFAAYAKSNMVINLKLT